MNIVYHFRVRGTGAEGVHIAGIVEGFRALGHHVSFVCPPVSVDPTVPRFPTMPPTSARERAMHRLLHQVADGAPQAVFEAMELSYNGFAIPHLVQQFGARKPDFLYERYAFFNLAGALASRAMRLPFVVEVNELAGFERVRGQHFVRAARAIERFVLRQASLVITVSDFLRARVAEIVGNDVPVVTIPNGVPSAWRGISPAPGETAALRQRLGLAGKRVMVFIGGLVHWHDFGMLLEAVSILRQRIPDIALLIVGSGPSGDFITAEARRLNVDDAVHLTGRVPHADVPKYIALADAAVIPATNEYRSPIKLFEYMALGKPIVAPRMPPVEAIVAEGRTAFLFGLGDARGLAAAMSRALEDPSAARRVGETAREEVFRHFTWEAHAQRILTLLANDAPKRSLSRRRGGRSRKIAAP